jgi:carbon monoxide dehydrogenase subunit G
MKLEHSFTVPVGVEDAWTVLLDIERIAPCMPGAAIDSVDGDDFTGTVKVKLGPIGLTYKGKASFVEKDAATHRAVIDARGRDSRGNGTANAKITATLTATPTATPDEESATTTVHVVTDLDITGKPAQFGRGVMVDVGNKLIGQFADCLAGKLSDGGDAPVTDASASQEPATQAPGADEGAAAPRGAHAVEADEHPPATVAPEAAPPPTLTVAQPAKVEPINLIESAGPAIVKRLAPIALVALLLFVVLRRRATR